PRLAARYGVPVAQRDRPIVGAARDRDGAVVLLRAVEAVGKLVVGRDVVELRRGLVVHSGPGGAAVERYGGAAVVPLDHAARILGIDPQDVAVPVGDADARERLAAVHRAPGAQVQDVHGILVRGIGGDGREVPRPHHEFLVRVDTLPARPRVVGAEDAAARVGGRAFDAGPQPRRIGGRYGDPDAAQGPRREPPARRDIGPAVAAVAALPQSALAASRREAPGEPLTLPHGGVEDARVRGVQDEVDRARRIVDVQHLAPGLAAVG